MTTPLTTLYVAWVEPGTDTRRRFPIARLTRSLETDGPPWMSLRYLAGVHEAVARGFRPFPAMEDLTTEYRERGAFFLVRQRIMRPARPDYADWLASLGWPNGFDTAADPFRVLVRSGGRNATDRLEFFAPIPLDDGRWRFEFFVRYVRGNAELAPRLARGERPAEPLRIVPDPSIPSHPENLAVRDDEGRTVGYVPAYYNTALRAASALSDTVEILSLNAAPEASAHRLLVACEATLPPTWTIADHQPELAVLARDASAAQRTV